jgi:hypothetical protein
MYGRVCDKGLRHQARSWKTLNPGRNHKDTPQIDDPGEKLEWEHKRFLSKKNPFQ